MNLIEAFTNEQLKTEVPEIKIGDTVRVHNRIKEGNRERTQLFDGTTVTMVSYGAIWSKVKAGSVTGYIMTCKIKAK